MCRLTHFVVAAPHYILSSPVAFDYAKGISKGQAQAEALQTQAINSLIGSAASWSSCRRLNESVCPVSSSNPTFSVAVYNPLAQSRTEILHVPVSSANVVITDAQGRPIPSQVWSATAWT